MGVVDEAGDLLKAETVPSKLSESEANCWLGLSRGSEVGTMTTGRAGAGTCFKACSGRTVRFVSQLWADTNVSFGLIRT
jgi:hypothetical protein